MNLDAAIIKDFSLHNNNNNEFIIEISTGKILNHKLCLRSVHSHNMILKLLGNAYEGNY